MIYDTYNRAYQLLWDCNHIQGCSPHPIDFEAAAQEALKIAAAQSFGEAEPSKAEMDLFITQAIWARRNFRIETGTL